MTDRKPSADDMHIAAMWLNIYDGAEDAEDAEACGRVRDWLLDQADKAEFRQACREAGISVTKARQALKNGNKTND